MKRKFFKYYFRFWLIMVTPIALSFQLIFGEGIDLDFVEMFWHDADDMYDEIYNKRAISE